MILPGIFASRITSIAAFCSGVQALYMSAAETKDLLLCASFLVSLMLIDGTVVPPLLNLPMYSNMG